MTFNLKIKTNSINNTHNNLIYQTKINTAYKVYKPTNNNNNQLPQRAIDKFIKQCYFQDYLPIQSYHTSVI